MMITRRESLRRLLRLAAVAPLAAAAGCMVEPDESTDQVEQALSAADEVVAPAAADVVVEIDGKAAEEHFAAMQRCLREHGVEGPTGRGLFHVRLPDPPPGHEGVRKKFIIRAGKPAGDMKLEPEAVELDERTREAMRACVAQIGLPGSAR